MVTETNPGWADRLSARLKAEIPLAMEQSMMIVEGEAKRQVYLGHPDHLNRQTGNLSRATTTELEQNGDDVTASVGNNLVYFPTHEFGAAITDKYGTTRIIPPRPFLTPAFQAKKGEVIDTMNDKVESIIRSECV